MLDQTNEWKPFQKQNQKKLKDFQTLFLVKMYMKIKGEFYAFNNSISCKFDILANLILGDAFDVGTSIFYKIEEYKMIQFRTEVNIGTM